MRFLVMVKASKESEAGIMPSAELFEAMEKYNEELMKAGVVEGGAGLHPSSKGARVNFHGRKQTVIDGPFAETKELVAGYGIWQTGSLKEAVDWATRAPFQEGEVEIRQIFEPEDFGAQLEKQGVQSHEKVGSKKKPKPQKA